MTRAFARRLAMLCCGIVAAVCIPAAGAEEQVTLRNDAVYLCARHTAIGDATRLYFGASDVSYQDILTERIVSIVTLPDEVKTSSAAPASLPATPIDHTSPTRAEIDALLASAGTAHDIDAELLASVVKVESDFRVGARSRTGARGLMQLMPATARQSGVSDASQADQNIAGGTAYLDALLKKYHDDAVLALAAYNAGPAAVDRYHGVPPYRETRWYVYRVIREYNRRKELQSAHMVLATR